MTHPRDAQDAEVLGSDAKRTNVTEPSRQNGRRPRTPYEAPRMSTGDLFERIVMASFAISSSEDCAAHP